MAGQAEMREQYRNHRRVRIRYLFAIAVFGCVCYALWYLAAVDRQARLNRELIAAIKHKDRATIRMLLSNGANPNARESRRLSWRFADLFPSGRRTRDNGPTALQIALGDRLDGNQTHYPPPDKEIILTLLAHGAAINAPGQYGETALIFASTYLDADIISLLVEHGADVNALASGIGFTPLHMLVFRNDPDLITYLLRHGANVNAHARSGMTPLHLAILGSPEVVQLLLDRGADPNAWDPLDGTPLASLAIQRSDPVFRSDYRRTVLMLKRHGGRLVFGSTVKGLPAAVVQVYTKRVQ